MIGLGHALTLALAPQGAGSAPPPEPQNFRVTGQGSTTLAVAWDAPVSLVRIEWKLAADEWDAQIGTDTQGMTNDYTVTGLGSDVEYSVRARREEGALVSDWVEIAAVHTGGMVPAAVTATPGTFGQVSVGWASFSSSDSVKIYRDGVLQVEGESPAGGEYLMSGLTVGVQYSFTVSSVGFGGVEGDQSAPSLSYTGVGTAPVNIVGPRIEPLSAEGTGVYALGVTSDGSWAGDPSSYSFTYQWQYAPFYSYPWTNSEGVTTSTYPGPGELTYRCLVTATNVVGSATEPSNYITYP